MNGGSSFFAEPLSPAVPERTPPPHEGRVEFLRPPEERTRWHPTVTTFGPWCKVPVSAFLVLYQLVRIVWAVQNGTFMGGPALAWELTEVVFYYALVALLLKAIWASGKRGRRLGG